MKYLPGPSEIWKKISIDGREYDYYISNFGRVKNIKNHVLIPYKRGQRKGTYFCVKLSRYGRLRVIDIQRLVALHFIPNPDRKPEVNHRDLNHFNNCVENLEWCTRSENEAHKYFMTAHLYLEEVAV